MSKEELNKWHTSSSPGGRYHPTLADRHTVYEVVRESEVRAVLLTRGDADLVCWTLSRHAASPQSPSSDEERSDEVSAADKIASLTHKIESLRADLANCERRAEEAEARALFFETEMTRVRQEGAKKS